MINKKDKEIIDLGIAVEKTHLNFIHTVSVLEDFIDRAATTQKEMIEKKEAEKELFERASSELAEFEAALDNLEKAADSIYGDESHNIRLKVKEYRDCANKFKDKYSKEVEPNA